jgi:hypothetical protein
VGPKSCLAQLLLWRSSVGADGAPIVDNQHCQTAVPRGVRNEDLARRFA